MTDPSAKVLRLACFQCRTKRIKCGGTKPVCEACAKSKSTCEWPAGRQRKRTRREMEEAREAARAAAVTSGLPSVSPTSNINDAAVSAPVSQQPFDILSLFGVGPDSLVWSPGFTPPDIATLVSGTASYLPPPSNQDGEAHNALLIDALQQGTTFMDGELGAPNLQLYYYRLSGSTSMYPRINRINLRLQCRADGGAYPSAPQTSRDTVEPPDPWPGAIFDSSGMPLPQVYEPLFDLFFQHMGAHFPSFSRRRMTERFQSGTMSRFLANCVCALGARFADNAKANPAGACAPFIAKAQEFIVPLLHLPTHDVCSGLLLLAWASYGQGSESGLWQYSGMSIRMGIDLGVHEQIETYESPPHLVRTRLLFWSLFITDRVISFATGRSVSISDDMVEIPLPQDEDFFPDPSRDTQDHPAEPVEPVPFVQLVKLMVICGRIANALNGRRGRARTLSEGPSPSGNSLPQLQVKLMEFVSTLPPSLQWTADNFKHQQARGHGATFLALHLWANAVLALVYHPELLKSPSGVDTPFNASMSRSLKLALSSSRQISECVTFADLVAESSCIASPYIVQPLYIASMALIHERREQTIKSYDTDDGEEMPAPPDVDAFVASISWHSLSALLKAVGRLEHYWAGASSVANLLEKRSGVPRVVPQLNTFISLPDSGLLRRFTTAPDHPHNVAPPTETSMKEAAERNRVVTADNLSLSEIFGKYTVEGMSCAPANNTDVERLRSSLGWEF